MKLKLLLFSYKDVGSLYHSVLMVIFVKLEVVLFLSLAYNQFVLVYIFVGEHSVVVPDCCIVVRDFACQYVIDFFQPHKVMVLGVLLQVRSRNKETEISIP